MENIITEALAHFEDKTRADGSEVITLKSGAPEALRTSVMAAHGDMMPNDWIYAKYQNILADMSGYTMLTLDDLEDNRGEIVDGLVDVYNADRSAWLASNLAFAGFCDEAAEEYGSEGDTFGRIGRGQYMAIDGIYSEVAEYLGDCFRSMEADELHMATA